MKAQHLLLPMLIGLLAPPTALSDTGRLTDLPSLPEIPPPGVNLGEFAYIRRGDSLASFLSRHGLTLEQLKKFNPGLEVSDLTPGRLLRVSAPGSSLLEIRPVTAATKPNVDPSGLSPEKQHVLNQINTNIERDQRRAEQKARAEALRWRQFGSYYYDWKSWKLASNGTRVTQRKIILNSSFITDVAVTCKGMKVSKLSSHGWGKWLNPDTGETLMLMELCGNIKGAPKATTVVPTPERPKQCIGSRIACASEL